MSAFDEISALPRRTMVLFFVFDTSGSMEGEKIGSLNNAVREIMPMIDDISNANADACIKVACLEFSTGCKWITLTPVEAKDMVFSDLEAGGLTSFGEACAALNEKLSRSQFMSEPEGCYAPVVILFSDGEPTDNYSYNLEKLKANKWFKTGIKAAIAIGNDADQDVLAEFTGAKESVFTVHKKDQLRSIIRLVSVTSSMIGSKSSSVGAGTQKTKQEEFIEQVHEAIASDETLADVGIGDSSDNADYGGADW